MAARISGVQRVTPDVLAAMEEMNDVAPAHNPPYITAMRLLSEKLPEIPLVAAFETGFHATIPAAIALLCRAVRMGREASRQALGISRRQPSLHRHADGRTAGPRRSADHLLPPGRIEFAVCDSRRQERGDQHGHEPAVGLAAQQPRRRFRSVRHAGDHASRPASRWTQVLDDLAEQSGLLGLSGVSGDLRDLEEAAARGNARAKLALDVFVADVRHYLGAYAGRTGRRRRDRVHRRHRRERRATFAPRFARTWKSWASCSTPRPMRSGQGRSRRSAPTAAACKSGSCRPTKN